MMTLEKSCAFCGENDESYLYEVDGKLLCSVHICKGCGEEGYARHKGVIACDDCYLSGGEGAECENCGVVEHIDHISLGLCQPCEDKGIYYGGRR